MVIKLIVIDDHVEWRSKTQVVFSLVSGQWSGSFQDRKVVCFSKYLHPKDYHPHHSVCNWKQIHDLRHEHTPLLVRLSLVKDIKTFIFSFQECKVVCRPDVSPLWQVGFNLNDLATFPRNLTYFDCWKKLHFLLWVKNDMNFSERVAALWTFDNFCSPRIC